MEREREKKNPCGVNPISAHEFPPPPPSHPTTNGGMQNGSPVEIRTHCVHALARSGADSHAQSVLIKQNFCVGAQSEAR